MIKFIAITLFIYFFIDILLTQLFLDNFYHQKREKLRASIVENRILNSDYKYTFPRKKSFKSFYQGHEYSVKTNNLGFRDSHIRDLDKNNYYTIVIGDSMVEGVPFEFEDTIVGYLNKKLKDKKIKEHEFLNAGIASYSSYIYQKKIISILDENPWIKTDMVIVLLDKSNVVANSVTPTAPATISVAVTASVAISAVPTASAAICALEAVPVKSPPIVGSVDPGGATGNASTHWEPLPSS